VHELSTVEEAHVNSSLYRAVVVAGVVVGLSLAGCTPSETAEFQPPAGSASAAAGSANPAGPPTFTIVAAGDILLHPALWNQAKADGNGTYDFAPVFAGVKPPISDADLAICHLETPLAPSGGPFNGYPQFSVPPQIAGAIHTTGFDTCSTASNHTLDGGEAGVYRTIDTLDAAGVHHAGSYRSAAAAQVPNIMEIKGVRVAQLSYTFGFNGLTRPAGKAWIANQTDADAIIAEGKRARQAGADIVVVSLHWGTEYDHDPTGEQQQLATKLLAAPEIDLIVGCHAHVVQPFAKIGNKWVAYGMGNEVAKHDDPVDGTREGVMPRFTFTMDSTGHWQVTKAEAIPTWVDLTPAIRIVDLPVALAATATTDPNRHATYQAAYNRISGYLRSSGADASSLTIVAPAA
jgi:hypothetical protein